MSSISGSCSDLPTLKPERRQKSIGDAAAHDQLIDLGEQGLEHGELGRHLGTGDDREQRPRRLFERRLAAPSSSLTSSGPGAGDRRVLRDAVRARLRAMRGAERVHDVDIAERRHFLREIVGVFFLALVEAYVLEQHHFARRDGDAVQPIALETPPARPGAA